MKANPRALQVGRRCPPGTRRVVSPVHAFIAVLLIAMTGNNAHAISIVSNGAFTIVYVYLPQFDGETWDQHISDPKIPGHRDDWQNFTSENIDAVTREIMQLTWPSYFDSLAVYNTNVLGLADNYVHPPQFFGSGPALPRCVKNAIQGANKGVLQWDTIGALANCHNAGFDPSPQVLLVFSPEMHVANIRANVADKRGPDMCTEPTSSKYSDAGWHAGGSTAELGVPNHAALPTAVGCAPNFSVFTTTLTHEVVEILTDPDGLGYGTFASWSDEVADLCEPLTTVVSGNTLSQYAINQSQASCGIHVTCNARKPICQPHLDAPTGSVAQTWVFGRGEPLGRLTDKVHALSLAPPASRVTTNASLNTAIIVIQTGSDDLRGEASAGDNADVTLHFSRGDVLTSNINGGIRWADHTTYAATLTVPTAPAARVSDMTGLTISTHFGSGWGHDNWDIQSVALVVSFPSGSITSGPFPPPPVVHDWLLRTNVPLIRFTGHNHDLLLPLDNPPPDMGQSVTALNLVISTGNDDLRGGSGNNCDVTIHLKSGPPIVLKNVNAGHSWSNWSKHTIAIPLPRTGLRGGDITAVELYTHFRGLFGSSTIFTDNWNVQEVILEATLAAPATPAFAAPARE